MPRDNDFDLGADQIVATAVDIFLDQGLDAVSMRNVAARLGVSPAPLYSRVGNKQALVDAVAEHLLTDLAPPSADDEPWTEYAFRWARELRARLRRAHDSRLILVTDRTAYVEASRPLVEVMRANGYAADAAVQACRLLMWTTVGFVAIESSAQAPPVRSVRRTRSGGDPAGVTPAETDELFALQIRYVIDGIVTDNEAAAPAPRRRTAGR